MNLKRVERFAKNASYDCICAVESKLRKIPKQLVNKISDRKLDRLLGETCCDDCNKHKEVALDFYITQPYYTGSTVRPKRAVWKSYLCSERYVVDVEVKINTHGFVKSLRPLQNNLTYAIQNGNVCRIFAKEGKFDVTFNGDGTTSGVYLFRIIEENDFAPIVLEELCTRLRNYGMNITSTRIDDVKGSDRNKKLVIYVENPFYKE